MTIKLTEAEKIRVLSGQSLYEVMQRILLREEIIDQNREHFWVVGLEVNLRILFIELVSMGSVKATVVEPMEVFSLALQKRAVQVILVHNHPSGNLKPSKADINVTDRLYQVGKIVDCPVIDHFIISTESYNSFAATGLLEEISKSEKYVPAYVLKKKWEDKALEIGKRSEKIEIAKEMKRKDLDRRLIAEVTGLTIQEVDALRVRRKKK